MAPGAAFLARKPPVLLMPPVGLAASTRQRRFRPACFTGTLGEVLLPCAAKVPKSALERRRIGRRTYQSGGCTDHASDYAGARSRAMTSSSDERCCPHPVGTTSETMLWLAGTHLMDAALRLDRLSQSRQRVRASAFLERKRACAAAGLERSRQWSSEAAPPNGF